MAASFEATVLLVVATLLISLSESAESVRLLGLDFSIALASAVSIAGGMAVLVLHALESRSAAALEAQFVLDSQTRVTQALVQASDDWQQRQGEGIASTTLVGYARDAGLCALSLANMLASSASLAIILLVAAAVDLPATAVVLVAGAVFTLMLRPLTRVTRRWSGEFFDALAPMSDAVGQVGRVRKEMEVFGVESAAVEMLVHRFDEVARASRQMRWSGRFTGLAYRDLAIIFLLAGIVIISLASEADLASVATVALLVLRSVVYGQQAQFARQQHAESSPAVESIARLIAEAEEHGRVPGDHPLSELRELLVQQVSYVYASSGRGLSSVSFRLARGEILALTGPSGSGKSTLAELVLRLRTPTAGRVLVDGVDYVTVRDDDWHRLVAFLPQEAGLVAGSVAENIAFFRGNIHPEAIRRAATLARIDSDIRALPHGYDSRIGPGGIGLSVGQRQRLALARALVGQPRLLVLDEPTSALDARSRDFVIESLLELREDVAVLLISHDHVVLSIADRVGRMADGVLTEVAVADALPIPDAASAPVQQ